MPQTTHFLVSNYFALASTKRVHKPPSLFLVRPMLLTAAEIAESQARVSQPVR